MRSSKSRSRGKNRNNNNRPQGNIVNRVFDSSGPEGKVRGTPQQIIEKYQQLHRDAQLSNDRVAAENFQQHAEHYARMLGEALKEQEARREAHEAQQQAQRNKQQQNNDQNQGGNQGGRNRNRGQDSSEGGEQPDVNVDDMSPAALAAASGSRAKKSGDADVIDLSEESSDESGLVETAETKPKRKPRTRKPKADQVADADETPETPAAE
ncbi:uncharacterized protein DUF4167 [Litoreibacter ponti]|uniref:Uncharacterized protein DUF4167 n=1 Tax=Litoreibacter ponti TaxID=1510457 RepID=A0A2T6BHZ8_9RHOB|nr:DUF4167 domain-containing protein [Litoreibacter ponti]PTX55687.1 uncharacterized protein DUF4167 [Litoreibacter ponti]